MLLLLASAAHAIGLGTTFFIGEDHFAPYGAYASGHGYLPWLPSLDIDLDGKAYIQIHALEIAGSVFEGVDPLYLGAAATAPMLKFDSFGEWKGVVSPGGRVDFAAGNGNTVLGLAVQGRVGVESPGRFHMGVYAVPGFELVYDNDFETGFDGTLQVSFWTAK
jgi:hypothetical protein